MLIVPSPSEAWFWAMSVGADFRRRAGLTLERCSQLAAFAIQAIG